MNGEPSQPPIATPDFTGRTKIWYFVTGNVVPSLLLMASARSRELNITWQSGHFRDYGALLLSGTSGWIFYPFFVYAVAAFTLGTLRPRLVCRSRIVLFGVMTGVLLSLQTCFLLGVVLMNIERWNSWRGFLLLGMALPLWGIAAIGLPPLIGWCVKWLYSKLRQAGEKRGWIVFLMFIGPLLGLALGGWLGDEGFTWLVILLLIPSACILAGGPFWIVAAYASLLFRLFRFQETRVRFRLADLLVIFAWLGAYLAAWRFAVEQAVETYASLPTTPPSQCYIATAAAQGHAAYVQSFVTQSETGETMIANPQLQYLKCAELAVKTLSPRWHRWMRQLYDRFGPVCASQLRHPLAADVAYTALKPVEWLVRLFLRTMAPHVCTIAPRLYRARVRTREK